MCFFNLDLVYFFCFLLQYLETRAFGKTFLIEDLIVRNMPEELKERKKFHEEEMEELSKYVKLNLWSGICF